MRKKLIALREQYGFTQQTFSDAVGISKSHYGQIETGEKSPSLDVAIRIKQVLCHKDDDIFFDYNSPESRPVVNKYSRKRRR